MAPIANFIQRRNSEAVTAKRVATKTEKQRKLQAVDADAKHATGKSVSPSYRTDWAPRYSPLGSDDNAKATNVRPSTAHNFTAVKDVI